MWARNNIYHMREQKHNSFNTKIQKTMITPPPPWPQFPMAFQSIRYFHTHHLLRLPPIKLGLGGEAPKVPVSLLYNGGKQALVTHQDAKRGRTGNTPRTASKCSVHHSSFLFPVWLLWSLPTCPSLRPPPRLWPLHPLLIHLDSLSGSWGCPLSGINPNHLRKKHKTDLFKTLHGSS